MDFSNARIKTTGGRKKRASVTTLRGEKGEGGNGGQTENIGGRGRRTEQGDGREKGEKEKTKK